MLSTPSRLSRRTLFAGAGAAGALAAAVSVVPGLPSAAVSADAPPQRKPERGGGYSLTERVQRYYATARV